MTTDTTIQPAPRVRCVYSAHDVVNPKDLIAFRMKSDFGVCPKIQRTVDSMLRDYAFAILGLSYADSNSTAFYERALESSKNPDASIADGLDKASCRHFLAGRLIAAERAKLQIFALELESRRKLVNDDLTPLPRPETVTRHLVKDVGWMDMSEIHERISRNEYDFRLPTLCAGVLPTGGISSNIVYDLTEFKGFLAVHKPTTIHLSPDLAPGEPVETLVGIILDAYGSSDTPAPTILFRHNDPEKAVNAGDIYFKMVQKMWPTQSLGVAPDPMLFS